MGPALSKEERRLLNAKAGRATLQALDELGGQATRHQIISRALDVGGFTPRELEAPVPEGTRTKHKRLVDYRLSWALTNLKSQGLLDNPSRGSWRLVAPVPGRVVETDADRRARELAAMPYHRYLRTQEWKTTRTAALERAGHRCSLDATHTANLDVHHSTYERLGREEPADLVVLCRDCHSLHHETYGRPRRRGGASPSRTSPPQRRGASLLSRLLTR